MQLSNIDQKWETNTSREKVNNLCISLRTGTFLTKGPANGEAKIYAVVSLGFDTNKLVSDVMSGTRSPNFNFEYTMPLNMTADLDRHLRTSKVTN